MIREKRFPGITANEIKRKKSLEIKKLELEIERLDEETAKQNSLIDLAEQQIKELINRTEDIIIRQRIFEHWLKNIEAFKKKGDANWEIKEKFIMQKDTDKRKL